MLDKIRETYEEFPVKFWVLAISSFIDVVGATMVGPFFALYITQKFNVGVTQAGTLFAIFSVCGLLGSVIGGALTDKLGRRGMVLFGLVFSALSSVTMGLVGSLSIFYMLAVVVGLLSNIAGPARQAMVADLLPEEKRAEGYGVLRVLINLSWVIGPTLGGILAGQSYLLLFVLDAVSSLITAAIVYALIPETKPKMSEEQQQQTFWETLGGYRVVTRDTVYIAFLVASMLMLLAYRQCYSTLSVFLYDVHSIPAQGYGLLMSMNAATVVLLQFWVTKRVQKQPPLLMMAAGTGLMLVGLTMYGLVSAYGLFMLAMLLITFGEMLVIPTSQSMVAKFAPEDMRGRYMAVYSLSWAIPGAVATWSAGLIMDNYNPNWVWLAAGLASALSAAWFCLLYFKTRSQSTVDVVENQPIAA